MSNVRRHTAVSDPSRYSLLFHRLVPGFPICRSWLVSGLLVFAAQALSGCAAKQAPSVVRLEVSAQRTYFVDGAPVEQSVLATALSSKRRPGEELFVHVIPLPGATYAAVHSALEAVQKVGAKTGMVGNVLF